MQKVKTYIVGGILILVVIIVLNFAINILDVIGSAISNLFNSIFKIIAPVFLVVVGIGLLLFAIFWVNDKWKN